MESSDQEDLDRLNDLVTYDVMGRICYGEQRPTDWLSLAQNSSSARLHYEDKYSSASSDDMRFDAQLRITKAQEFAYGSLLGLVTKQEGLFNNTEGLVDCLFRAGIAGHIILPVMDVIRAQNGNWRDDEKKGLTAEQIIARDETINRIAMEVANRRTESEREAVMRMEQTVMIANPFYPTEESMLGVLQGHLHMQLVQTSISLIRAAFPPEPLAPSGPSNLPHTNQYPAL